jgi:hypothetical protein
LYLVKILLIMKSIYKLSLFANVTESLNARSFVNRWTDSNFIVAASITHWTGTHSLHWAESTLFSFQKLSFNLHHLIRVVNVNFYVLVRFPLCSIYIISSFFLRIQNSFFWYNWVPRCQLSWNQGIACLICSFSELRIDRRLLNAVILAECNIFRVCIHLIPDLFICRDILWVLAILN